MEIINHHKNTKRCCCITNTENVLKWMKWCSSRLENYVTNNFEFADWGKAKFETHYEKYEEHCQHNFVRTSRIQ